MSVIEPLRKIQKARRFGRGFGRTLPSDRRLMSPTGRIATLLLAVLLGVVTAGADSPGSRLGASLSGLSPERTEQFDDGRRTFLQSKTVEQGLGPYFNDRSCVACHHHPVPGGGGTPEQHVVVRLVQRGGSGPERSLSAIHPRHAVPGYPLPRLSPQERVSRRLPPALLGLGLIEAIPDEEILAHEDEEDRDGDGISGRAHRIDGAVARFGWKAQVRTLFEFVSDAYLDEMGITSPFRPYERISMTGPGQEVGAAPRPDANARDIYDLAGFIRFLAPPPRRSESAELPEVRAGERLFHAVGCADCHVPTMNTGRNLLPPLSGVDVALYSDLLLHDMGSLLDDGVPQGDAASSEWRTAPLWGLSRTRTAYLHDGRADTVVEAVRFHGGEAAAARASFERLSHEERTVLLKFLGSL